MSAADVYVNTTGNDATGTGTINNPYLSVSKGVSKVSNGGLFTLLMVFTVVPITGDNHQ